MRKAIGQATIAKVLGVGRNTVDRWTKKSGVNPLRCGKRVLYSRKDLVAMFGEERTQELFGDYFDGGDSE